MIFYLGQTVLYTWGVKKPAIVTGFTGIGTPQLTYFKIDGELVENDSTADIYIEVLREKDDTSPSGKKIYYGGHCRFIRPENGASIKPPTKEKLKEEFKKVENICIKNE